MKKALVAYFSASGVTEQVAEKLASAAHSDCFRIQPKIVYTKFPAGPEPSNSPNCLALVDMFFVLI